MSPLLPLPLSSALVSTPVDLAVGQRRATCGVHPSHNLSDSSFHLFLSVYDGQVDAEGDRLQRLIEKQRVVDPDLLEFNADAFTFEDAGEWITDAPHFV
ncbi:hypothetical protein LXA43DRAFT_1103104 [Ganoderma leucocontextum]|nr:hypothetical protein LXA43DRAFT_1103104 [Ganoderma leucocontextum]